MLNPEAIPRIDGDMTALADHADSVRRTGIAIADTGARVHQTWQELGAVYIAPEAGQLLAATGPVMSGAASVGEDIESAAAALRSYAADTAYIQSRLDVLRLQAVDLVDAYAAVQDESTTVTLDDHGAELSAAVAAEIAAWEAAQLRCANAVRALSGTPRLTSFTSAMTLVEHGGTTTITPRGPSGPLREIFPIDQTPPISSTGNPPVVFGPGMLINIPAPPSTGIIDGPGSYRLPFGPGSIFFDKSTSGSSPGPADQPENTLSPEQKRIYELGQDPASRRFRPSEAETASRLETALGITLTRAPETSPADWLDQTGATYDAIGNFPAHFFDRQWPQVQIQIVRHLGKADWVPIDVSRFEPGQVDLVKKFIEDNQLGPRVFILE